MSKYDVYRRQDVNDFGSKSQQAPERIYATVNGASTRLPDGVRQLIGGWSQDDSRPEVTEYVRMDVIQAMNAEIDTLKEALKPFATVDPMDVYEGEDEACAGEYVLTQSDFNRARKAMGVKL